MNRTYFFIKMAAVCLVAFSCRKFVDIPSPKNQLVDAEVFADSTNATSAVLGIYINMLPNFTAQLTNGGLTIYGGLLADELYPTANNTDENEFYTNNLTAINGINSSLWRIAYSIIYNCNACIEGLQKSKTLAEAVKRQLMGESKLARAFLYFNLVQLYGALPLVSTTDYKNNKVLNRTAVDSIYRFVVTDLKEAQGLLSSKYVSAGRFRPNIYSADALLAKVYLAQKNWPSAEALSAEIIGSGLYSLETDPDNVFKVNSNETIWKLAPVFPSAETWEGNFFIPTSLTRLPKYVISNSLLSAFEPGDQRKAKWLKFNTVNGQVYFYPFKYKVRTPGTTTQENFTVFRLAEQYLIRAEARVEQNNLAGGLDDLNIIRGRAGLTALTAALTKEQVYDAVQQERRIELFCEWGNRWMDLKRTGRADLVLSPVKGSNWQATDVLLPIPQTELNNNPFLEQNPGYH